MEQNKKPELLSPVGSPEALVAAVENGADAIYLGGKKFSARQYASNFDEKELKKVIEYCHIQGVRVYITINTLLKEEELSSIIDYIVFLYKIGVDALIIQDLGLLKIIQRLLPDFPFQSSTQMTIHSLEGVKLLEREGFYRVVLARELSLKEIKSIVQESNTEIKIFNHGALCICYSGQCLMSSMIGGRSGNRGRCAQPCRKRYSLVDLDDFGHNRENKYAFLLSPKDLSTLEQVKDLIESGAHSFKIEGRMKRPEYVAIVTSLYRKAIDQYYSKQQIEITEQDIKNLKQIFNRGFTTAYLFSDQRGNIISKEKPNNRGLYLGKIYSIDNKSKKMHVLLEESLEIGDGIEVWTEDKNNSGMQVSHIEMNNREVKRAKAGEKISLSLLNNVKIGNSLYKTSDISLLKEAQNSFKNLYHKKRPIWGAATMKIGKALTLGLWDENHHFVSIESDTLVEKAIHRPMDRHKIQEQLGKLGGTPFELIDIEIDMDENSIIPIKEINQVRRKGIESLTKEILKVDRRIDKLVIKEKVQELWKLPIAQREKEIFHPFLVAKVNRMTSLKAVLETDVSEVIFGGDIDFDIKLYEKALNLAKEKEKSIVFSFPRITRKNYIDQLVRHRQDIKKLNPDGLLLSNLEMVHFFRDFPMEKEGDFTLNAFNHFAIEKLEEMGLENICISPELTLKEIEKIQKYTHIPLTLFVHGFMEMMISEYCPIACKQNEQDCYPCRNNRKFGLKDEKGITFPLYIDDFGRSHILNSQKLCLLENLSDVVKLNFKKLRIQFNMENEQEIIETMKAYEEYLNNLQRGRHTIPQRAEKLINKIREQGLTKGHYYRGVL